MKPVKAIDLVWKAQPMIARGCAFFCIFRIILTAASRIRMPTASLIP